MTTSTLDLILALFVLGLIPLLIYKKQRQMGKTWEAGIAAKVSINNHPLSCQLCKCNYFLKREALIPTTFLSLFRLNFFNQSGSAYVCQSCGYIHWFCKAKETAVEMIHERSDPSQ